MPICPLCGCECFLWAHESHTVCCILYTVCVCVCVRACVRVCVFLDQCSAIIQITKSSVKCTFLCSFSRQNKKCYPKNLDSTTIFKYLKGHPQVCVSVCVCVCVCLCVCVHACAAVLACVYKYFCVHDSVLVQVCSCTGVFICALVQM